MKRFLICIGVVVAAAAIMAAEYRPPERAQQRREKMGILPAGSVGSAEIADDAVGASEIAAAAVGSSEIGPDAVGASELGTNAVTNTDMADNAVGSAEVIADSLGAGDLAPDSVGASELQTNAVTNTDMADNAVGSAEIIDASVAPADATAALKTKTATVDVGALAATDQKYLFVAPYACTIVSVSLVNDTATTGSDPATNYWSFQVDNLTASNTLGAAKKTSTTEMTGDTPWAITATQNLTVAEGAVLELDVVKQGSPTALTNAEVAAAVEYY